MNITIGIDFGSDSVRAIAVDVTNGQTYAEHSSHYPRWKEGLYCDASRQIFRHHPSDYLEAMTTVMQGMVAQLTVKQQLAVRGIGIDATGSTVCPLNEHGTPLALLSDFSDNPCAMFHLWKDHSANEEAKEINNTLSGKGRDYLRFQGAYSAEWFWAKILHTIREEPRIAEVAQTWAELADWIPAELTGRTQPARMYRCACAAGHKALWNTHFDGLPDQQCLAELDPYLAKIAAGYVQKPGMSTDVVGFLSPKWQDAFHLPQGIIISGSSLDAHAGAVGAGIKPRTLVKVLGTSTVDMAVITEAEMAHKPISGTCGIAQSSILPHYLGLEAGQAAFGDIFEWFRCLLCWPIEHDEELSSAQKLRISSNVLQKLEAQIPNDSHPFDLMMLDWFNGRRYPNNNDNIRASAIGFSLGSDAPSLLRAMMLGAVMGSKAIFESFLEAGVEFDRVIAVGGIAQKSPYVMQLLADALNRKVFVSKSTQTCALGAAMYAAVATGCYASLRQAQAHMNTGFSTQYAPDAMRVERLARCYQQYQCLARMTNEWYS